MVQKSGPICQSRPTHCMRMPLRSTEQIYLVFLIPTLMNFIIWVVHFSADLVMVEQHFREENPIWASCTLAIMYAPAIAYFVLTVSRPDWWMSEDEKLSKGVVTWFILQVCQLFLFPIFALYRYAGQIVLAIDAIGLSGLERTKTLNVAAKPAAIELYFFLQAWFQAMPQAVFQTHLLFRKPSVTRSHQSRIQVLSILMSIVVISLQTMSFQRFESQKINGRKLPWAMWLKKYRDQELQEFGKKEQIELSTLIEEEQTGDETVATVEKLNETTTVEEGENSDELKCDTQTYSYQSSETPPLPPKNAHITPPPTPLRGVTMVTPLPVPDMPAPPRPDFLANNSSGREEVAALSRSGSAQSTVRNLYHAASFKLPKRTYSQKGLDEDDPIGRAVAFLWWFLFITPRIFSMGVFYEFHPVALFSVLAIHYLLMLSYLFYYAKEYTAITFFINLWLGLVYIVSAIEYKIKFKYADRWLIVYYTLIMTQNTVFTIVWYFYAEWDGFWYNFMFYSTFCSMALCLMSTMVYHVLFKPKKRRVYNVG